MPEPLATLSDLRVIAAEEGLHKMYAVRKSADRPTTDIEEAHAVLTAEMRKRGLFYDPLVTKAAVQSHQCDPGDSPDRKCKTCGMPCVTVKAAPPGQPAPGTPPAQAPGAQTPPGAGTPPGGPAPRPDYSVDQRRQMAESGHALPDGSFPIQNEADLHDAVRLVAQAQDPQAAMMHIIERARAMGMENALPPAWQQNSGIASPQAPPAPGAHSMPGPGAAQQPTPGSPKKSMAKRVIDAVTKAFREEDNSATTFEDADDIDLDPDFGYAVVKSASEERFTLGPIYLPGTYDAHDEWATAEDLRKSVHDYVRSTGSDRQVFLQHSKVPAGEWIEIVSWPQEVTATMHKSIDGVTKAESVTLPAGTPFLGVIWEPWAWEMVKAKKITGFSMGGYSRRVEAEIE